IISGNIEDLRSAMFNRLKKPAFQIYPDLKLFESKIKKCLSEKIKIGFSGSGSTFFILCNDEKEAVEKAQILIKSDIECFCCKHF
ncbi:MAG: hypothetical protein ABIH42_08345, partial [Planctomycetota bacterium]